MVFLGQRLLPAVAGRAAASRDAAHTAASAPKREVQGRIAVRGCHQFSLAGLGRGERPKLGNRCAPASKMYSERARRHDSNGFKALEAPVADDPSRDRTVLLFHPSLI